MLVAGIDEAGRGPVIGPMTICCYVLDEKKEKKLHEAGVKDSKLLTPESRERIYRQIRKIAHRHKVVKIPAGKIDKMRDVVSLNELEAEYMGGLIKDLRVKKVFVDSPDRPPQRFAERIRCYLNRPVEIHSHNRGERFPVVAAASVMAKVERDREIRKLHRKHGFFGSGYPSDDITIDYLKKWIRRNKDYPSFVRKSWWTSERLMEEKVQRRIGDWF